MRQVIFLFTLFSLLISDAYAKKIVVAVIDSGFAYTTESLATKHLCKYGHRDFTEDQRWVKYLDTVDPVPQDFRSHGTQMTGIIEKNAGKANYCFVILKIFPKNTVVDNTPLSRKAFRYATDLKVDIINYSAGGVEYDLIEYNEVIKYLNQGGILVASAGNNSENLDEKGKTFYPAMYDSRIKVVGNLEKYTGSHHYTSNYGKVVKYWEIGTDIGAFGMHGTGTSQAAAVKTGKLVKKLRK